MDIVGYRVDRVVVTSYAVASMTSYAAVASYAVEALKVNVRVDR